MTKYLIDWQSFLRSWFENKLTWTPEIAFTTVDLPWATWPIVPIFIHLLDLLASKRLRKKWDAELLDLVSTDFAWN